MHQSTNFLITLPNSTNKQIYSRTLHITLTVFIPKQSRCAFSIAGVMMLNVNGNYNILAS